jgi:hypothetical protein
MVIAWVDPMVRALPSDTIAVLHCPRQREDGLDRCPRRRERPIGGRELDRFERYWPGRQIALSVERAEQRHRWLLPPAREGHMEDLIREGPNQPITTTRMPAPA